MSIWPMRPVAVVGRLDAPAQRLDVVAVDGAAGQHHLEAVVVLRVVAAGDLDAAGAAVFAARGRDVVEHRRGDRAQVHHVQAGGGQAADQRRAERRAGQAPVAADRHGLVTGQQRHRAEGTAQFVSKAVVDGIAHHAADVVGLEDGSGNLHGVSFYGSLAVGRDCRQPGAPRPAAAARGRNHRSENGRYSPAGFP
jgi:hypothetical protein